MRVYPPYDLNVKMFGTEMVLKFSIDAVYSAKYGIIYLIKLAILVTVNE